MFAISSYGFVPLILRTPAHRVRMKCWRETGSARAVASCCMFDGRTRRRSRGRDRDSGGRSHRRSRRAGRAEGCHASSLAVSSRCSLRAALETELLESGFDSGAGSRGDPLPAKTAKHGAGVRLGFDRDLANKVGRGRDWDRETWGLRHALEWSAQNHAHGPIRQGPIWTRRGLARTPETSCAALEVSVVGRSDQRSRESIQRKRTSPRPLSNVRCANDGMDTILRWGGRNRRFVGAAGSRSA